MASQLFRYHSEYGELRNGARFDQETFHRLYENTPEQFKAELIGGIVSVLPRGSPAHGSYAAMLCGVVGLYESKLPIIDSFASITLILGTDSEPHADLAVHFDGRVSDDDDYVRVPPDFVAEVAYTPDDIELHAKKHDYERHGVREYMVLILDPVDLIWFALGPDGRYEQVVPDEHSVIR